MDHHKEGGTKKDEKEVFTVKSTRLKIVRAQGNYNCTAANKRLTHTSMMEVTVHLLWNSLDGTSMLQRVDYTVSGYVPPSLPGWKDTVDNIGRRGEFGENLGRIWGELINPPADVG